MKVANPPGGRLRDNRHTCLPSDATESDHSACEAGPEEADLLWGTLPNRNRAGTWNQKEAGAAGVISAAPASILTTCSQSTYSPRGFAVRVEEPEPPLGAYPPSDEGPREPEDAPELLRGRDDGESDSLPEPPRGVA